MLHALIMVILVKTFCYPGCPAGTALSGTACVRVCINGLIGPGGECECPAGMWGKPREVPTI